MHPVTNLCRSAGNLALVAVAIFAVPHRLAAAQRAFYILQSPSTETVPGNLATNFTVTLTYSNASGTINNAVFTNGVSVAPSGQGVTASLSPFTSPIASGGGTGTLPLTIAATASAAAGSYTAVVWSTNGSFTANTPIPGVVSSTNLFIVGASANSNAFSTALSPVAASGLAGLAANYTSTVTLVDYSSTLAGWVTNGLSVSGPDTVDVTASLDNQYAALAANFGQTDLTLTITVNAGAAPGAYTITVNGTNAAFTANLTPGVASATYTLTLTNTAMVKPAQPAIQSFGLSGSTLTITGTNGVSNWPCVVLASTNLALSLSRWTPVITNTFDGSGECHTSFGLTNTLSSTAGQQFFTLFQPTNPLSPVASPTFSPAAAPYYSEQAVTITSATSGATIRYTTDGSTPTETHGTVYAAPVTMPEAVDTNLTGFLTNCSGVTMLKAIAYQSGAPDSAVSAGSYEILVPMKYPPSASPVVGIAHVAYHVTGASWSDTLNFWTNYFGFAAVVASSNFALIKINDQQYVELYQGPLDPAQFQLANWGFQVTDAEVYREQLAAAGIPVPPSVSTNALGNLSFFTTDPDGHTNEWVQYATNSVTGQSQGQYLPGTQVFGYINGMGDCTTNETAADNYYIGQCGFVTNQTHDIYVPNVNGYVELLTANPGQVTAALAGKHEKIQLLNFQGAVLSQSLNTLTNRDPSIPVTLSVEGSPGTKQQNCADVYDDDGSRVRLVDE